MLWRSGKELPAGAYVKANRKNAAHPARFDRTYSVAGRETNSKDWAEEEGPTTNLLFIITSKLICLARNSRSGASQRDPPREKFLRR